MTFNAGRGDDDGSMPERPEGSLVGHLVVAADGRYLDADLPALDMFGVTLDVLRGHRFGDFAPEQFKNSARHIWTEWVSSGDADGDGEGTLVRPDGSMVRVRFTVSRRPDETFLLIGNTVDESPIRPHAVRVQTVLARWRELERELARLAPDAPEAASLRARIDAIREEYQRRTGRGQE